MRQYIIICLVVLSGVATVTLHAQAMQTAMTPMAFNARLTEITDSLNMYGQKWGEQFSEARKSGSYTRLKAPRESMERFVNLSIERLKAMKDVSNSKDLRMAMIHFLEFEKSMLERAFKPMEKLSPAVTKSDEEVVYNQLARFSAAEAAALEKMNVAQESYARANGFQIVTLKRP